MTKICKHCGHKKGDHKFYKLHHDPTNYCCCKVQISFNNFGAREDCGCTDFSPEKNTLVKVYQCGQCGAIHLDKNISCCGDLELEESYQCSKCGQLFSENFKHECSESSPEKNNIQQVNPNIPNGQLKAEDRNRSKLGQRSEVGNPAPADSGSLISPNTTGEEK